MPSSTRCPRHGATSATDGSRPPRRRPPTSNSFCRSGTTRLGFAYRLSDKSVIRAGWGLFFTELEDDALHQSYILTQQVTVTIPNNGRADFGLVPFGGPAPAYEQLLARACDVVNLPNNSPNCYPRSIPNGSEVPFGAHDTSYSHMASVGMPHHSVPNTLTDSNAEYTGG